MLDLDFSQLYVLVTILILFFFIIVLYYLYKINKKLDLIKNFTPQKNKQKVNQQKSENEIDQYLNKNVITSPMVGIAYLKPSPKDDPFIKVGEHIKQGDTVILIEAMKTYNKIRSPYSGVIKEILISDNKPVEFGEKLIVIE